VGKATRWTSSSVGHSTVVQIHLSGIMEMINNVDRSTQETSFKALLVEIAYCLDDGVDATRVDKGNPK
jgi:hypothetical protein